jgi:toxin secretion/phage lysis holin
MGIDFITGLIVGGVFHKSPKTDSGTLESKAGWKGLCKKGVVLFFVFIGTQLDILLSTEYIRDGICIAFIVNELLSIIENAGLMGIPVPNIIKNSIELLKGKSENNA